MFSEQNLHQACGNNARVYGVMRGYLLLPPQSRLSLDHISSDDRNFLLCVYKGTDDNGDTFHLTKTCAKNKKMKIKSKVNFGNRKVM